MDNRCTTFNLSALKQREDSYRIRLHSQPDDMENRVNLAWCLFMLALHQSGRESTQRSQTQAAMATEGDVPEERLGTREYTTEALVAECLRHLFVMLQCSHNTDIITRAETLLTLIRQVGGETALASAQSEADRLLAKLACAIVQPPTHR